MSKVRGFQSTLSRHSSVVHTHSLALGKENTLCCFQERWKAGICLSIWQRISFLAARSAKNELQLPFEDISVAISVWQIQII